MSPRIEQLKAKSRGPLRLKRMLKEAGIPLSELAQYLGISRTAVSLLANHGIYPATTDVGSGIQQFLLENGLPSNEDEKAEPSSCNSTAPDRPRKTTKPSQRRSLTCYCASTA